MRDYTRKAKRVDNGEWIIGCLLEIVDGTYRIATSCLEGDSENLLNVCCYEVVPETICDPTSLTDKNGQKIWENDVCKYFNPEDKDGIAIIHDDYVSWISGTISEKETLTPLWYLQCSDEWEVIGNVFDNAELLKE